MLIWSEFRMGEYTVYTQYRDDDHREDAFHFTNDAIVRMILSLSDVRTFWNPIKTF